MTRTSTGGIHGQNGWDSIGIEHPDRVSFDGEDLWEIHEPRYRTNTKMVDRAIGDHNTAVDLVGLEETRYGLKTKVRRMVNNLRKTSRLADRYDDVMIHLNARGISVRDIDDQIARPNQILARL